VAGTSGNPTGRPRSQRDVQRLAESYSAEAVERLAEIMRGRNQGEARQAAVAILDRAYGRPAQALDVTATRFTSMPEGFAGAASALLTSALEEEERAPPSAPGGSATVHQPVADGSAASEEPSDGAVLEGGAALEPGERGQSLAKVLPPEGSP
jgi:hypothetical protein